MQMVMSQKSYADGDVTEELCRCSCHRRAMQMVMSQMVISQNSFADGDVTDELCRR